MNAKEVRSRISELRFRYYPRQEERSFQNAPEYPKKHEDIREDRLVFLSAFQDAVVPVLESHLDMDNSENILEVGCGTGFFSRHLAPDWLKDKLAVMDINHPSLEKLENSGYYGSLVEGSVYALPFENSSLDAVIGYSSFDSFLFLNRALHEVKRVLKPGGKLVLFQDLVTAVYSFDDNDVPIEQQDSEKAVETVELYHAFLIDEVKKTGFKILEGKEDYLETKASEPIREVKRRVPDLEIEEKSLPIPVFWDRGNHWPEVREESRIEAGISKETFDHSITDLMNSLQENPGQIRGLEVRAGDLVIFLRMRYLIAEK